MVVVVVVGLKGAGWERGVCGCGCIVVEIYIYIFTHPQTRTVYAVKYVSWYVSDGFIFVALSTCA